MRPRGQVTIGTPDTQPPGRWLTTKTPVESIAGDMPDATVADERGRIQDMQMTGQSAGTIAGWPPLVKGDQLGEWANSLAAAVSLRGGELT